MNSIPSVPTSDKDYIVQIKVKNGPFLRAMRAGGFKTLTDLAGAAGVAVMVVCNYANLKKTPFGTKGRYSPAIMKISEILGVLPEDLFPPQHLRQALKKNMAEVDVSASDVASIMTWGSVGALENSPEDKVLADEAVSAINRTLGCLPAPIERVLRLRFGFDGKGERTLEEISGIMGLDSRERVRQLEATGLRLLKHPKQSRVLRGLIEYMS